MCGYKHAFSSNLLLVIVISIILLLTLAGLVVLKCVRARRGKKGKTRCTAWTANFSLRFAYEFFLEICLCVFIHVRTYKFNEGASDLLWALAVLLILAMTLFVAFLVSIFFRGGPYVPGCYSSNSLSQSFWGVRPLCPDSSKNLEPLDGCVGMRPDLDKKANFETPTGPTGENLLSLHGV
jgi:hypothetical protein